jgi:hypothetical protein
VVVMMHGGPDGAGAIEETIVRLGHVVQEN